MTTNDYFVHESKRLDWSYQYIIFYLHAIPPAKNLLPPAQKLSLCSLEMPHKSSTVLAPFNCVCVYICVVGRHGGMHVFAQQRSPSPHLIYFRVRKCARDFCCYNDTSKVQPQPLFMQCCVLYSLGWHTVRLTVSRKNVAIVELDRRWD